jgi:hypothetical protein
MLGLYQVFNDLILYHELLQSVRLKAIVECRMTNSMLATKKDVEEIVGRVVSQIVGDALQRKAA